ncbi:MAG: isoleucine--tRNA ligase [Clostridia bacterium]|nr:isoleucine--tRNA ligase [Clostridia bacterium]
MKKELDRLPDIGKVQEEVLKFWKEDKTFEKSVAKEGAKEVVFYDGPPFPTGKPHHGTVLVSFIKDMVARYHTMQGYSVPRQWGWDCHGLPIEVQVENAMGITNKTDIENKIGVAEFNNKCYERVSQNNDAWREYVEQMARWVDYDNAYKTMNTDFMESVIWAFKELYNKGLIYKDYRVTPYCHRCETALSISETRESDSTRPRQDRWTIAKFKTNEQLDGMPVYMLAWTTTPWTLPSNMALAVGENIEYAYAQVGEQVYVAAKNALGAYKSVFGDEPKVLKTVKGADLVGKTYTPLFDFFANLKDEGAFKVISADFVAEDEGIAIVHIAPAFGEDDYWACKKNNVPLVCPVNEKGKFTEQVPMFEGKNVFETNTDVVRYLKERDLYVADGSLVHNYPHCWRCGEPLIYKAMEAWYVSIDKLKDRLVEQNEKVNWVPEYIKTGRFGNWLANARDWNISRNRYWSTPIPVWECECCGKRKVAGSIAEIEQLSGKKVDNLHKQYLDEIQFKCECGHTMKRVSEVLDCWFESGSVPFARLHYPFENKAWFEEHSPSDFVVEYTGQIRCWFYYLHVLSVALFDKPAYKNCVVHGTVLAKDGKKLSKKSKNYTDPMELMKSFGTDAFRLYMYDSNAMLVNDMQFDEAGLKDSLQQIVLPFWNCAYFYQSYSQIDNFVGNINHTPNPSNKLDKWILSKLYATAKTIKDSMDNYRVDEYIKPIISLIDGLSNWYIRRSRRRFWASGLDKDKQDAYETLYYVLINTAKLLAPVAPIVSEKVFKSLTNKDSVHLELWPNVPKEFNNQALLEQIDSVQDVIHLARGIRNKQNIKNRQPLSLLQVAFANPADKTALEEYKTIIAEELNVKNIEFIDNVNEIATVNYKVNFATVGKTMGNKIPVITKAIKTGNIKLDGGKYYIDGDEQLVLNKEDILVTYVAKSDKPVASDERIVVALDLNITPELKNEGVAREIVRNIQDARKTLELNITDRIQLCLSENCPAVFVDYICKETLADLTSLTANQADFSLETEGVQVLIKKY